MLNENLPDINDDIRKRLLNNIKKLSYLKMDQKNLDDLMRDLNNNYLRTTNKIIFDKFYYSNFSNLLIIDDLKLPPNIINNPDIRVVPVREKGLEPIPPYNYITSYKDFTFKTLLCKKEIIDCLQKIKEEFTNLSNDTDFNALFEKLQNLGISTDNIDKSREGLEQLRQQLASMDSATVERIR